MRAGGIVVALVALHAGCLGEPTLLPIPLPDPAEDLARTLPAALLWRHPYPHLLVEIDYAGDREPSSLALDTLRETLHQVTDKEQIVIQPPTKLPEDDPRFSDNKEWTVEEIAQVHEDFFDARVPGGYGADETARLHILYLNGGYMRMRVAGLAEVAHAAGVQVRDALILFPDDAIVGETGFPWDVYRERRTLIHELGHALGLVNNGIPMQRPHVAEDGVHSNNPESVMAVSNGGPIFLETVQDNEWLPYKFDADDLADLAAFREVGRAFAARAEA